MEPVNLILDTDIGPDCDDAGALACVHALQGEGSCSLLAVTHCTSNPYGAGCIDAINRWYGRGEIPVGTLKGRDFLNQPEYRKYNQYISQHYPNRYPHGEDAPDAVHVLRKVLADADDGSIVLCAIGPLINLAALLACGPDQYSRLNSQALIAAKVKRLVVMGGGWTGPEWNFEMDPHAAAAVCDHWPSEIWFSTFNVGGTIITGGNWNLPEGMNPVCDAYRLHSPEGRMSWDQTAVWAAVMGTAPFFALSEPGKIRVDEQNGASTWTPAASGNHRYLVKTSPDAVIASCLDDLMKREK